MIVYFQRRTSADVLQKLRIAVERNFDDPRTCVAGRRATKPALL